MLDPAAFSFHHPNGDIFDPFAAAVVHGNFAKLFSKADKLFLVGCTKAFSKGGKADCFQEIGFSLRICAGEDIHSIIKGYFRFPDISKITDL